MAKRDSEDVRGVSRRDFMQLSAAGLGAVAAGAALSSCGPSKNLSTSPKIMTAEPMEKVRIGFVGAGGMGTVHVQNLARIQGAQITAVCDIREAHAQRAAGIIQQAGHPAPKLYTRGERDFERLCAEEELDLVYTATPWRWHVPVCVAAMTNGKHAATEVPAAITLDACWQLVETAEKTNKHCVMMENCCYDRIELMILRMVREGLLGELLHAECGYLHDLRGVKFSSEGEGLWRREYSKKRNADLYPTHGLGPVAQDMNINRGDRFARLVSMSSPTRGLHLYAEKTFGSDSSQARETFKLGDVVTTLIQTEKGKTIVVTHDTNTPRPYSRDILVQGTKGLVRKYPDPKVHIEGRSPGHSWEDADNYLPEFEHPLYDTLANRSGGVGHGGMDYIEDYRLIQCLRAGAPTDLDVYDSVSISAVVGLSERSIAKGNKPVDFPDFTRGLYKKREPLGIVTA